MDGHRPCDRARFLALVGVGDHDLALPFEPKPADDVLRQHEHDGAGVHHALHRRAADRGFVAQALVDDAAVGGVFQFHGSNDLAHWFLHERLPRAVRR